MSKFWVTDQIRRLKLLDLRFWVAYALSSTFCGDQKCLDVLSCWEVFKQLQYSTKPCESETQQFKRVVYMTRLLEDK